MPLIEPPDEISDEMRDMNRAVDSIREELEAVNFYAQRIEGCHDEELKALLAHNRDEEKEHAAMLLEWLRRRDKGFAKELQDWLFTDKPFVHK